MMRRRPILFWPLAVAAGLAALWWALHVPYRPSRLYAVIPVQATYISAHRNLAARWDAVSANPLTQAFFASANMREKDWQGLNRDPQFRDWLNRLAADEFVMAYVPHLAQGEGGWVFASWLGGRSQRLRIALQASEIPGITYVGKRRGWPVWVATPKLFRGGEVLAFSLVEGMLVASYARNIEGINTVLACVDGRYPSLRLREGALACASTDEADRGWWRIAEAGSGRVDAAGGRFAISSFESNRIGGRVSVPFAWLENEARLPSAAPESIAAWQADLPSAVALLPAAAAQRWIGGAGTGALMNALSGLIRAQAAGPLIASLYTGDYRGTMFGLRLPALFVGATSAHSASLPDDIANGMARINAARGWDLAAASATTGVAKAWTIASGNPDVLYRMSLPGDQVCFAAGDDWVMGVSCFNALTNVLRDAVLREGRPNRLQQASRSAAQHGATAYAWLDLPGCGPALKTAAGGYTLRLKGVNTRSSHALRRQVDQALAWVLNLQRLGQVEIWAKPDGAATEFGFATTPSPP